MNLILIYFHILWKRQMLEIMLSIALKNGGK